MTPIEHLKSLSLEISNPCNERCVHCYRVCDSTRQGFLTIEDVRLVFKQIENIRSDKLQVTITGGEALLNRNWKEILTIIQNEGCSFSLFSNGTLLSDADADFVASLVSKGLKEVQLSIYALDPVIHDNVTNLKGSLKKTLQSLQKLRMRNVPVFVSCPAMQVNKNNLADLMRWADKEKIPSCVDLFIFGASDYSKKNLSQRLNFDDLKRFYEETVQNNRELAYVWGNNRKKTKPSECLFYGEAANGLCISGDGSIYPMIGWYEKLGDIHQDSIVDVYTNHPILQLCRKIKVSDFSECIKCDAYGYCSLCPLPHLSANHGNLLNLDKSYCDYVHKVKELAQQRDKVMEELAKNKKDVIKSLSDNKRLKAHHDMLVKLFLRTNDEKLKKLLNDAIVFIADSGMINNPEKITLALSTVPPYTDLINYCKE